MIRAFSYGGGVQSTAALVLAGQGEIDYPLFLFANVGDDSELPATLKYVREIAMPYAEHVGVELLELRRTNRPNENGTTETLLQQVTRLERSLPIPVRMSPSGMPGNRLCTLQFKIRVIEKELRRRGATKERKAAVGLGISLDEYQRAGSAEDPKSPYQLREYPLIDRRISRQDAMNIIARAGLPIPPKSACYFCPFHRDDEWQRMARTEPDLFAKAVELERLLHERGRMLGRGDFYFSRHNDFLDRVYDGNQTALFEELEDGCESGYCMT